MNWITGSDSSGKQITIQLRADSGTPGGLWLQFQELGRNARLDILTLAGLLDVTPPRLIRLGAMEILPELDHARFFIDVHSVRVDLEELVAAGLGVLQLSTPAPSAVASDGVSGRGLARD